MTNPEELARRLAASAIADDDPTAWFEQIYVAAEAGQTAVPWDHGGPSRFLVQWAQDRDRRGGELRGDGRRAVVVGCGLGDDAEFIAAHGFDTTGFDISPAAVRTAQRRHPDSSVRYTTADLLNLAADWLQAYDLVIESNTLQALPDPPRGTAIASVGRLVAPGGTLLVLARAREPGEADDGPPWALTRAEIDALAGAGLAPARIEDLREPGPPPARRWRAEFSRP
jgi:SAM-dependent methyltransferase